MANRTTPYLGMAYNETLDKGFRTRFNLAMDTFDATINNYVMDKRPASNSNLTFPEKRASVFDDTMFAVDEAKFSISKSDSRYLKIGNVLYFEVAVISKVAINAGTSGDIANITIGSFNVGLKRYSGDKVYPVNHLAASYGYIDNTVVIAALGGMFLGTTVPIGTKMSFGGHFLM